MDMVGKQRYSWLWFTHAVNSIILIGNTNAPLKYISRKKIDLSYYQIIQTTMNWDHILCKFNSQQNISSFLSQNAR